MYIKLKSTGQKHIYYWWYSWVDCPGPFYLYFPQSCPWPIGGALKFLIYFLHLHREVTLWTWRHYELNQLRFYWKIYPVGPPLDCLISPTPYFIPTASSLLPGGDFCSAKNSSKSVHPGILIWGLRILCLWKIASKRLKTRYQNLLWNEVRYGWTAIGPHDWREPWSCC